MLQSTRTFTLAVTLSVSLILIAGQNAYADVAKPSKVAEPYCQWQLQDNSITEPLCGYIGNAERGKVIASDSNLGNCVACHQLPIEGIEAFGSIGPPLAGVGSRLTERYIRLRIVDTRTINPRSIMPGFYRQPELIHRPLKTYAGRTFLSAQQIEDVVAYLVKLK